MFLQVSCRRLGNSTRSTLSLKSDVLSYGRLQLVTHSRQLLTVRLSTRQLKLEQAVANLESDIREQAQKVAHTPDASSTMQMVMYDPSTNVMTPVMVLRSDTLFPVYAFKTTGGGGHPEFASTAEAPYADSQMSMMPMVCMVQSMPEGQFGVQETSFQQLHYQESATQETAPQESAPVEHTGPQETTSQETAVKEAPLEEVPAE